MPHGRPIDYDHEIGESFEVLDMIAGDLTTLMLDMAKEIRTSPQTVFNSALSYHFKTMHGLARQAHAQCGILRSLAMEKKRSDGGGQ